MKLSAIVCIAACCVCLLANASRSAFAQLASSAGAATTNAPVALVPSSALDESWYFAVSGDSRDCGDIIMPGIAAAIERRRKDAPVNFYWHLGDFRAMYRVDCDIAMRQNPAFKCPAPPLDSSTLTPAEKKTYLDAAWSDFRQWQLKPFGTLPVYLGIGNHELGTYTTFKPNDYPLTRQMYYDTFKDYLTYPPQVAQLKADAAKNITAPPYATYYHFIMRGVDFIYLDNASRQVNFDDEQLKWLERVLAEDKKDASIKTIIVGMHAALPQSAFRGHAMDQTCEGLKSGLRAYDLLFDAQKSKNVYVFASHSHFYEEDIYNTTEHQKNALRGWIIGTAGAEQYVRHIMYGYMQVKVQPDGKIATEYVEVTQGDLPKFNFAGADALTKFCFAGNKRQPTYRAESLCSCESK